MFNGFREYLEKKLTTYYENNTDSDYEEFFNKALKEVSKKNKTLGRRKILDK